MKKSQSCYLSKDTAPRQMLLPGVCLCQHSGSLVPCGAALALDRFVLGGAAGLHGGVPEAHGVNAPEAVNVAHLGANAAIGLVDGAERAEKLAGKSGVLVGRHVSLGDFLHVRFTSATWVHLKHFRRCACRKHRTGSSQNQGA